MNRVAVATTSTLAAEAAAELATAGGNAVDCALAAALVAINTQPGVCALMGSAYVTIWAAGEEPVCIDGNVAVPGIGLDAGYRNEATDSVSLGYGGGITTLAGCGAVAVPGTPAALARASTLYGERGWAEVLQPAIRAARQGFPLPQACHYYLQYSAEPIFSRSAAADRALRPGGRLLEPGETVVLEGLADSLAAIAEHGVDHIYTGPLGQQVVDFVRSRGGPLTAEDLAAYEARERACLMSEAGDWAIALNPPPAVGGVVLASMLTAFGSEPLEQWTPAETSRLAVVQREILDYRKAHLDLADDRAAVARDLLEHSRRLLATWTSGSTVHTSAVDSNGLACAITASSGYGSGEIAPGTGLWLNNCLGELELNRRGLGAGPPGSRLPSNMSPTIARRADHVISMGSPGADRITTALHQFILHALQRGLELDAAIDEPRLHVDTSGEVTRLMLEPGLPEPVSDIDAVRFDALSMYFGGVAAAAWSEQDGFRAAADRRREGGVLIPG